MALTPGTRIGPYEIVGLVGSGGMGEVYRARDAKLNRDVALKVLPGVLAGDPDRLARFQREAQVLGALNHPNIAHIHGFEDSPSAATGSGDIIHAIVMELVEGPTLADRIAQGPIALDETLPIARQIAEALEAAHELAIVHRDLKPANVKVRDDGVVKVLDFGLAKALDPAATASGNAMNSPTLTARATQMGTILGTAAYMAPEQAKGRSVDRRADIWAFGVVLFEMLTAERCFKGEDISDTLAAVLRQDVDWAALPAGTPPRLQRLLERCLDRDVKQRLRDIGEARVEIAKIEGGAPDASAMLSAVAIAAPASARATIVAWAVAGVATATLVAALVMWAPWTPAPPALLMRLSIEPPAALPFNASNFERSLAISPDATRVAYVSQGGELVVRAIDSLDAKPIPGISGARQPFFSHDGKWVGFAQSSSELKKVSINGGPAITICPLDSPPRGASWGADDTIYFATASPNTGLFSVPAGGGEAPAVLTKKPNLGGTHLFPSVLPGGRGVLFTISTTTPGNEQIAVLDLATGVQKTLVQGGGQAEYVAPGYLVYGLAGSLRAVPFDLSALEVRGDAVAIVDGVAMGPIGASQFSVARNGALFYMPGTFSTSGDPHALVWIDRAGRETPTTAPLRDYFALRLSPDGTRVALDVRAADLDVWIWHLGGEKLERLTLDTAPDNYPIWTPDSERIVFRSARASALQQLFWQAADNTGQVEQLTASDHSYAPNGFSPDGAHLLVNDVGPDGNSDISVLALDTRRMTPLIAAVGSQRNAAVSPNGRFVAYESSESGTHEVYVKPFPNVNDRRWQISTEGGQKPVWSADGRELFYAAFTTGSAADLWVVPVTTTAEFTHGKAAKLFSFWGNPAGGAGRTFDVSRDGKRFIAIKNDPARRGLPPAAGRSSFVLVVNWIDELRGRIGRAPFSLPRP